MFEIGFEVMEKVGFNKYESLILQALFGAKEITVLDISQKSGVPRSRVYQILKDRLVNEGYVQEDASLEPKKYSIDLEKICDKLQEKYPITKVEEFRNYFSDVPRKMVRPATEYLRLVPTGDESEKKTLDLYKSAQNEILILSRAMGYISPVYDGLFAAVKKGVRIRVLFAAPGLLFAEEKGRLKNTLYLLGKLPGEKIEIRYLPRFHIPHGKGRAPITNWIHGSIIDPPTQNQLDTMEAYEGKYQGAAIITIDIPEPELSLIKQYGTVYAILTREPRFVMSLAFYFELLWSMVSLSVEESEHARAVFLK